MLPAARDGPDVPMLLAETQIGLAVSLTVEIASFDEISPIVNRHDLKASSLHVIEG